MKYIFYLLCSKIGIVFSGSGRSRLSSALSAFTKAQDELRVAIQHEKKTIKKAGEDLEKAQKAFEKKKKALDKKTEDHELLRTQSEAYLQKIEAFLTVDAGGEKEPDPSDDAQAQNDDDNLSAPENEKTTDEVVEE